MSCETESKETSYNTLKEYLKKLMEKTDTFIQNYLHLRPRQQFRNKEELKFWDARVTSFICETYNETRSKEWHRITMEWFQIHERGGHFDVVITGENIEMLEIYENEIDELIQLIEILQENNTVPVKGYGGVAEPTCGGGGGGAEAAEAEAAAEAKAKAAAEDETRAALDAVALREGKGEGAAEAAAGIPDAAAQAEEVAAETDADTEVSAGEGEDDKAEIAAHITRQREKDGLLPRQGSDKEKQLQTRGKATKR